MATKDLDSIVLKRNIGRNAPDLICQLATSGTIPSLEEFITNAHDADAEHVSIAYNEKKNTLIIEDDGTGMNARDLTGFYRLGDSQKAEKPVTAKGRKCIGKFGIATILLKSLAREYALETFKDGKCISVTERFDGDLSSDQSIPYKTSDAPKDKHGTKLTLTDLTFQEGDGKFSIKDFIKRLQWDVPIRPDFEVKVNDTVIVSKRVANADEFQFTEEDPKYGSAHGTFYLTRRATPDAGVHIYVNGRRVGDPKALMHKVKNAAARIVGIVNADGLERAILFDRGRFKEDDAGYVALTKALRKFIGKIEYTIASEQDKRRFARAKTEANETLSDARRMLNTQLSAVLTQGKALGMEFGAVNGAVAALYDPTEGRIRLNNTLPQFRVTDAFDAAFYRAAIIDASIDALVAHAVGRNTTIANFLRTKQEYVQKLYAQTGKKQEASAGAALPLTPAARAIALASAPVQRAPVPVDNGSFSDIRMYEPAEVSNISGLLLGTVNRLFESGMLKTSNGKAKGEHVKDALQRISGYTSLHEILHKMVEPNNLVIKYNTVTENFKALQNDLPYLRDFGEKKPCFFVKSEFVPEVGRALNKRITRAQLLDNLQKAMDKHFTLSQTAHMLGVNQEEVKKLLVYVGQHNLHLPKSVDRGEPSYHFFYAAKAYQDMRSGIIPKNAREVDVEID